VLRAVVLPELCMCQGSALRLSRLPLLGGTTARQVGGRPGQLRKADRGPHDKPCRPRCLGWFARCGVR
jgi:hypothetical protein